MTRRYRSYLGAPRVYLTYGIHDDGEWKRMWFVNAWEDEDRRHFWTWREAIDHALSLPTPPIARRRSYDPRT